MAARSVLIATLAVLLLGMSGMCTAGPCGEDRRTQCDFTFINTMAVPTFTLKRSGDNAYGVQIMDKSRKIVKTLNTNGPCYMGEGLNKNCTNQFYFQQNRVASRTFQVQNPVRNFTNTCVKLMITSVEFNSTFIPHNLNPGDGVVAYPESRRCIFFSTAATYLP